MHNALGWQPRLLMEWKTEIVDVSSPEVLKLQF